MKEHADKKRYVKESPINVGDNVHVKAMGTYVYGNTYIYMGMYDDRPLTVVERKGSMITAQHGEQQISRNSSYFKPSPVRPTEQRTVSKPSNIDHD